MGVALPIVDGLVFIRLGSAAVRRSEGCPHPGTVKTHRVQPSLMSAPYAGRSPLGHPGKHIRIRRPYRLPLAAAPTLFGLAAAFCLTAQAPAGAATAPASTPHAAAANITYQPGAAHVTLLSLDRRAADQQAKSALPTWYTARSGDSLAAIAKRFYHNSGAWPVLYWANHHRIHSASEIKTGQVLRVPVEPARIPDAPALVGQSAAPAPAKVQASAAPMQAAPVQAAPVQAAPVQAAPVQAAPVQAAPVQAAPVQAAPLPPIPAAARSSRA